MPPMFDHHARRSRAAERRGVKGRHQRRAFAAGRHVAAPEVGHHVDAGALGNAVRIPDLQRECRRGARPVQQRLPVAADGAHLLRGKSGELEQPQRRVGEHVADGCVQFAQLVEVTGLRIRDGRLQSRGQRRGVVGVRGRANLEPRAASPASPISSSTASTPSMLVPDIRPA